MEIRCNASAAPASASRPDGSPHVLSKQSDGSGESTNFPDECDGAGMHGTAANGGQNRSSRHRVIRGRQATPGGEIRGRYDFRALLNRIRHLPIAADKKDEGRKILGEIGRILREVSDRRKAAKWDV